MASLILFDAGTTTKVHERMWSAPRGHQSEKTTSRNSLKNAFHQRNDCQEASSSCRSCQCLRSAIFLFSADVKLLTPYPHRQEKSSGESYVNGPSQSSATHTEITMLSLLRMAVTSVEITAWVEH